MTNENDWNCPDRWKGPCRHSEDRTEETAQWLYKALLQRTHVLFPAPTTVLQLLVTPAPADLMSLVSEVTCTHVHKPAPTHTYT